MVIGRSLIRTFLAGAPKDAAICLVKEGNGKDLWQAEAGDSEKEKKRKACPKTLSAFGHVSN